MTDNFFGNEQTASSDLPRYSINDTGEKTLSVVQGVYEDSIATEIKGKIRLLHQIHLSEPIDGKDRIFVWGNFEMDQVLPTLVPGTKIRVKFAGKEKIGGGHTMKRTPVEYPANAKRRANPFAVKAAATEETPF